LSEGISLFVSDKAVGVLPSGYVYLLLNIYLFVSYAQNNLQEYFILKFHNINECWFKKNKYKVIYFLNVLS
jgi:hypothetical protein